MARRLAASTLAVAFLSALAGPALGASPDRAQMPEAGERVGPTVDPVPAGTVGITSSVAYLFGEGEVAVVAEVLNNAGERRQDIVVEVTFYDVDENPIGTISGEPFLEELAYGSTSPAIIVDSAPAGAEFFTVAVSDQGAVEAIPPIGALTVTRTTTTIEGDTHTFEGDVYNPTTFGLEAVVAITTFDANGDVIDAGLALGVALTPNSQGTFIIELFYDPANPPARALLVAQGRPQDAPASYATSWNNYFDDVGTSSFRKDIIWLAEQGITKGCGAGKYCPASNVRRDEMASFLARALGLTASAPDAFVDDEGNTHQPNINRIAAAGITAGCNPAAHLYCPAANVRRDEMASFLSRALGLTGVPANAFTDDNGNTHELNINRVAAAGVTTGCGGTNYCPANFVTRAQMAAFLHRAFDSP
jgi:S-layer homology domain